MSSRETYLLVFFLIPAFALVATSCSETDNPIYGPVDETDSMDVAVIPLPISLAIPLPDTLICNMESIYIHLINHFENLRDSTVFRVSQSIGNVAASIVGTKEDILQVTGLSEGYDTITVTAIDGLHQSTSDTFVVGVGGRYPIPLPPGTTPIMSLLIGNSWTYNSYFYSEHLANQSDYQIRSTTTIELIGESECERAQKSYYFRETASGVSESWQRWPEEDSTWQFVDSIFVDERRVLTITGSSFSSFFTIGDHPWYFAEDTDTVTFYHPATIFDTSMIATFIEGEGLHYTKHTTVGNHSLRYWSWNRVTDGN